MGNMLSSNEETLEDKLDAQLIRIVDEYQQMDLNMVYIAIFKIQELESQPPSQRHTSPAPSGAGISGIEAISSPASSTFPHPVYHGDSHSHNPGYPGSSQPSQDTLHGHSQSHSAIVPQLHHQSGARSNIKHIKTKQEIKRITDLEEPMLSLYQSKERQIVKQFTNITEQEKRLHELRRKHGFDVNAFPNTNKFPSLSSLSPMKLKGSGGGAVDEKEKMGPKESISSAANNDQSIKVSPSTLHCGSFLCSDIMLWFVFQDVLRTNDIISSVRSLGDTTDKLCEILDKAKVIRKMKGVGSPVIHIRGHKNTVFSYYLIGDCRDANHIIISYARSASEKLEFMEWIKIQSKLEKLEGVLRDINTLLKDGAEPIVVPKR